jgi:hypothetical protein
LRIGIVTILDDRNSGTYWQAQSTLLAIRNVFAGADVEFMDLRQWPLDSGLGLGYLLRRQFRQFRRCQRKRRVFRAAWREVPRSRRSLETTDYSEAQRFLDSLGYDLLVAGSDTIFHCWPPPRLPEGTTPAPWLSPDLETPHVALSSSADITRYDQLSEQQKETVSASAKGFLRLAVRDRMTFDLIRQLGVEEDSVTLVPDPTFTAPIPHSPAEQYWARRKPQGDRPVCGVNLRQTPFARELVRALGEEYQVVAVSNAIEGTVCMDDLSPDEWAGIFGHFSLMVTGSFHETIYSLRHGIPVFSIDASRHRIDPETGMSKTADLTQRMGIPDHHVNPHDGVSGREVFERIRAAVRVFPKQEIARRVREWADLYMQEVERIRSLPRIQDLL